MFRIFALVVLSSLLAPSQPTYARSIAANCTNKVNAQVNISFNERAPTLKKARAIYDKKVQNIHNMAKQAGIDELFINSMNYNINPSHNYDSYTGKQTINYYQVSGNVSIKLDNEKQAMDFAEFLSTKEIYASLNMNSYKQGNCKR